jgi:2-polyprenyl-3-methyl-5-hydroxy-6-metoxy-1,4-benzoquinol methylase
MPYSSTEGKSTIKRWFGEHPEIKTIVDIGCGSGTYPELLGKDKYRWIGVEIWEPYVGQFKLREIYDELHIGNFFDVFDKLEGDCIIFGDVLEHMYEEDARLAIAKADAKFPHIVISTPVEYEQEATDNPYEKHLSVWNMEHLNGIIPPSFTSRGIDWDIAVFIK